MSRADYLGKQFFKIAQLTNSSICYENAFLSPRSSVRIQLTILLHLPNFKLFVTSCHKYVGRTLLFLSVLPWKAGELNQKVCKDLWWWSWRLVLDWKQQSQRYTLQVLPEQTFSTLCCASLFQSRFNKCASLLRHRRTVVMGQRREVYKVEQIQHKYHPHILNKLK